MNNDLISREALKEQINDVVAKDGDDFSNDLLVGLDMAFQIIDNAPTVAVNCKDCDGYEAGYSAGLKDAERPQGEWIMQRHDLEGCFYTCSNCGRMIRVSRFIDDPEDNETLADYPFCHCGAKMKGEEE